MSFRAMMKFANQEPAGNGLRFATAEEADGYGRDLFSRWTVPTGWLVEESTDPVTDTWTPDGGAKKLEPAT